jgi:hypothetical protein|tara:strand:+ start:18860 stop:19159 length:300 start_codon:yes stop_codon:yes gene_type:complete
MKKFEIVYMDGYDEVRDSKTHDVVFSTTLDVDLVKYVDRITMDDAVIDNVVSIWNETGEAVGNLGSGGKLDEYLLDEGRCTQEERETICESLYKYTSKS